MVPRSQPLRVGVVGVHVKEGWAKESHAPAIQSLPDLQFAAVATRNEESARGAAKAFGARHWFADPLAMVRSDAVDLVAVCVNVPAHRDLVLAALAAGKHVYSEWPLGRNLVETEEMAAAAERAGVHTAVGLQGRINPAARRERELLAQGAIGHPLTARVVGSTMSFGPEFASAYAYFDDPSSGANLTMITGGLALDMTLLLLGELGEVEAMTTIQFPTYRFTDSHETHTRTVPDHLLVLGRFASGCAASIEVSDGERSPWPFSFEITGSEGHLALIGGDPQGFQRGGPAPRAEPQTGGNRLAGSSRSKRAAAECGQTLRATSPRHTRRHAHRAGLCSRGSHDATARFDQSRCEHWYPAGDSDPESRSRSASEHNTT